MSMREQFESSSPALVTPELLQLSVDRIKEEAIDLTGMGRRESGVTP